MFVSKNKAELIRNQKKKKQKEKEHYLVFWIKDVPNVQCIGQVYLHTAQK